MSKTKAILYFLGASALAYGIIFGVRQVTLLSKTCVNFLKLTVDKLSLTNAVLTANLELVNKSNLSYDISTNIYDVFINEKFITQIVGDPISVAPNSRNAISIPITFNPIDLVTASLSTLAQLKNMKISISMKFSLKSKVILLNNLSFVYESTIGDMMAPSGNTEIC